MDSGGHIQPETLEAGSAGSDAAAAVEDIQLVSEQLEAAGWQQQPP